MSLKKNIIFNFILTASTIIFPLITFPYITRTISSINIGKVFFIDAFTQYFVLFSSIGIPFYGVREIAKIKNDRAKTSKLLVELVLSQFILSLVFSAVFIAAQFFIPKLHQNWDLIKISCLTIIANSFLIEWFYQGTENFSYITSRSLIIKIASVLCILFFVRNSNDYAIYYLIMALLVVANSVLNLTNFFLKFYTAFSGGINLLQHSKPLLVLFSINISVSVYTILDTIILGMLTNPQEVSLYNVPLKLVKIFWLVVSGVGTVLIPRMSSLYIEKDTDGISRLMTKSFSIVFLLTLPFCFFCVAFPNEVLVLISGQKYLPAANGLRILAFVPLVIGVCNVLGTQFLLPIGMENKILHATFWGLFISLALNFLLIPNFKFIGSSIACLAAELGVCIAVLRSARRHIKLTIDYLLIFQIILSLTICYFFSLYFKMYFKGLQLLLITGCIYVFVFLFLQFLLFKNKFVFSLISIYKKDNNIL